MEKMIVFNQRRQPMEMEKPIHEGGEGWICPLVGQATKLAKIYKPQSRAGRETKLRWMLANAPIDPGRSIGHASIAWPEALLYDDTGAFVGYVMPKIANTRMLLQVYNPRLRAKSLPGCDVFFLHRVARNLAAAIGALHKRGYVIGDLNESNILVTQQALVTVIDTDSFQAREEHDGQIIFYPCPVGRPEYTPPELQGKRFSGEVRQPEQDAFALAVLIFQILLGGNHPFRAVWLGKNVPPPVEERIFLGLFPYVTVSAQGMVIPPPNLTLDILHPYLTGLVIRCFVDGQNNPQKRPSPSEWENALKEAEKLLCTCLNHHVYSGHLKNCPQCNVPPVKVRPMTKFLKQVLITSGNVHKPNPVPAPPSVATPVSATQICVNCNSTIPVNVMFCPRCTNPIAPQTCIHCGFPQVPQSAKCCPRCGNPV
jgi:DNA-binding helix-hairpin-helix protein with protein kinase domain